MLNPLIHTLFMGFIPIFFRPFLIPAIISMTPVVMKMVRIVWDFVLMKERFVVILSDCFVIFLDGVFPLDQQFFNLPINVLYINIQVCSKSIHLATRCHGWCQWFISTGKRLLCKRCTDRGNGTKQRSCNSLSCKQFHGLSPLFCHSNIIKNFKRQNYFTIKKSICHSIGTTDAFMLFIGKSYFSIWLPYTSRSW